MHERSELGMLVAKAIPHKHSARAAWYCVPTGMPSTVGKSEGTAFLCFLLTILMSIAN
ncbi:hypothetical protein AsAng_0017330 [Aureispira anguillae]|uniref:Uncharacterized protein n=1 Tax=Aureispira anguillae TaxID=2864201 RepID=A0A915YDE3_9BACT|nr:hypothetical protein AsAng_0017330 [Aureispira anguillae]